MSRPLTAVWDTPAVCGETSPGNRQGTRSTRVVRMRIGRSVVDDIVRHAREELPNECCGLLAGSGEEIAWAQRARNLRSSPARFLIDPEAHFAAIRRARNAGLAVIGAYHSHPATAAWPSAIDRAESDDSNLVHVIVSLANTCGDADIGAFCLANGNIEPVELVLVG